MVFEINQKGSYYEIGFELGKYLRKSGYDPPSLPPERLELAEENIKLIQRYTPGIWDELQGLVKGGNFEGTSVLPFEVVLLPYPRSGCTIFAIAPEYTTSGKTLFARNYDWDLKFLEYSMIFRTSPKGALTSLGCCDLMVGRYGGINEAGLAIGLTAISGYPQDKPGIILHLATRWVLDTCETTKDAVSFLKHIPHFRGNNYLIADKEGDIALVEGSPEKVMVTPARDGLAYAANRYQSPEMLALEEKKWANLTTEQRHKIIEEWYSGKQGNIDEDQAQDLLTSPFSESKGVCCKIPWLGSDWGTIYSWTALLGEEKLNIAHGPLDTVKFKSYPLWVE